MASYQKRSYNKQTNYVARLVLSDSANLILIYEYTVASIALCCEPDTGKAWSPIFRSADAQYKPKLPGLDGRAGWLFWRTEPKAYEVLNQFIQAVNASRPMQRYEGQIAVGIDTFFKLEEFISLVSKNASPPVQPVMPNFVPAGMPALTTFPTVQVGPGYAHHGTIFTSTAGVNMPMLTATAIPTIQGLQIDGIPTPKPASPPPIKERSLSDIIIELRNRIPELDYEEKVESIQISELSDCLLLSGTLAAVDKLKQTYSGHVILLQAQIGDFGIMLLSPALKL